MLLSPYAGGQIIAENIITPQLYGALGDGVANDLPAFQRAVNAAAASGGMLLVPNVATGYRWAFTTSNYCLIVPSNVTIWAPDGALILPDVTTVQTAPAYPAAYGACIVSGNPANGQRSGQTGAIVDGFIAASVTNTVSNIHIKGLSFSTQNAVALGAGKELSAIHLWFAYDSSIENCYAFNMPNTGFAMFGGARKRILNNTALYCGWAASGFAKNGISSTGYMILNNSAQSSADMLIDGNICCYNKDEGIQTACTKGNIISNNILIANTDAGIEGDSAYTTTHVAADYSQEIPNDCIMSNNYIDGAGPLGNPLFSVAAWLGSNYGINYACGNQGRITANDNVIRNVIVNSGIAIQQSANGKFKVNDNYVENCTPTTNYSIFFLHGEYVIASDNDIVSPGASIVNQAGFDLAGTVINLTDNFSDVGNVFFATISGTCTSVIAKGNKCRGTYLSFIRIAAAAGAGSIDLYDNKAAAINSNSSTAEGFLKFSNAAFTCSTLRVMDNVGVASGATTRYPIMFVATGAASIGQVVVRENQFESFQYPSGQGVSDLTNVTTNFIQYNNGIPGQRILWQRLPPTAGTWAVGDKVIRDFVDGNAANGRVATQYTCTVAGTPGTWKQCGFIVTSGITANRPTLTTSDVGIVYLDQTLAAAGKPIWWTGTQWVDATGIVV